MNWKYRNKLNDFITAVSNDAESEGELWIYGDIVDDAWWDEEVSPKTVRDAIKDMGNVSNINIRVNSYGGSVYAGNAIINILDSYRKKTGCKINAYIEGIAASMGSCIPMVADKIYMAENAMYMLHKPWSMAAGNSDDISKTVEELQKAEDTLIVNYMRKFNGTEDELRQLLSDETWLTADEALEYGLCDEIIPAVPVAASANCIRINNREFFTNARMIAAKFIPGTPMAKLEPKPTVEDSSAAKTEEANEEPAAPADKPVEHVYDEALAKYGITEDKFKGMSVEASALSAILDNAFAMGRDSVEIDPDMSYKSKAYDKMVNAAIDEAIKSGIRAKGDAFNESKWRKILSTLDYDEIVDQNKEWTDEAKKSLHAGERVSEPYKPTAKDNGAINPDNYNFC